MDLYDNWTSFDGFMGILNPEAAITRFFSNFPLFLQLSLYKIQMRFRGIIFNFKPLNGHYLHPPFFPIQRLKRKKGPFLGLSRLPPERGF